MCPRARARAIVASSAAALNLGEWGEWGESGMRGGAGGLRRGLLFDGMGGCITCDVPIGEMEVLG